MKIGNVVHRGSRRLIEHDETAGLPADVVPKLRRIVAFLDAMATAEELRAVPTWKAHQLTGDRKGVWALHVTRNWRLTFAIGGQDVDILDRDDEDDQCKGPAVMTDQGSKLKNPPHVGGFLKAEIIEGHDLTVTARADALGVKRETLSVLLNERASLSPDMVLRFEKAFGLSMDTLMRMQNAYDIAQARPREGEITVQRYGPKIGNEPQPSLP